MVMLLVVDAISKRSKLPKNKNTRGELIQVNFLKFIYTTKARVLKSTGFV